MKNIFLSILTVIIVTFQASCQVSPENKETVLQELLERAVEESDGELAGLSLAVIAPDLELNWSGAAGFDSTEMDNELSPSQPYRIASVTKTFVAAAILKLYETGALDIEDPISKYISEEHQSILKSDGYDPAMILIRNCLHHRSGLFDYADGNQDFKIEALSNPNKRWTRTEQIQFAVDHGDPLGKPDEVYGYSDTGYILLGEIIEKTSNKPLAEALRSLLGYAELGLTSTWLESLEDKPIGVPSSVHRYAEGIDATFFDNSIDLYGGGGLSSTSGDLAKFFHSLCNNQVFDSEATLELMTTLPKNNSKGETDNYCMGLQRQEAFGTTIYLHEGFWGTIWLHFPEYNWTMAANYTNDANGVRIIQKTLKILLDWKK